MGLAFILAAEALMSVALISTVPEGAPPARGDEDLSSSVTPPSDSVVFGAVGDFDNKAPNFPDMVAEAKRLGNRGGMFLLGVGDLGYTSDEQPWCTVIKSAFNHTLVVAGNHDTPQSGPGDIDQFVIYCPFNVDASLVAGPTHGYGKSYYFDYPATNPLVRVLMVTPGITGPQVDGQDYAPGGAEYNWVMNAISDGRSAGIPWIVAGMHKLCINAGSYGCEMGQAFWDGLITGGVDLVMTGHYHVYERSYQVAHSASCTSVHDGGYNAACVVDFDATMVKGAGTVQVTDGAGGRDLYAIDTSADGQYFPAYMGSNVNSQGKSSGHGTVVVSLNATTLTGTSNFCPLGTGDPTTGECPSQAPSTFQDTFTISSSGIPPPPLTAGFRSNPVSPVAGQAVAFNASASGGTPPYSFAWDFGDGSSDRGANVGHAFARAGNYTVTLTVTDTGSRTATAKNRVAVGEPLPSLGPPVTSLNVSGRVGSNGWYVSVVTVTLTATSPSSPDVTIAYRLDGGAWRAYDHFFPVGEGLHTLEYHATDGLGNTEAVRTISVQVDASPPQLALPPSGGIRTTATFKFSWGESDEVSGLLGHNVSVDGFPFTPVDSQTSVTLTLPDGEHTIAVRATDYAGNQGWGNVTLRVDTNLFSPTGPLQGMPTYELAAIVAGATVIFLLHRRRRSRRIRQP